MTNSSARLFAITILLMLIGIGCKKSTVKPPIDPPQLILPASWSAIAGVEFSRMIEATDPQGLSLTFQISGLPDWLEFDPQNRILSGIPAIEDAGVFPLSINADNGTSGITRTVTLRVFTSEKEANLQAHIESAVSSIAQGLRGVSVAVVDAQGTVYAAHTGHMGMDASNPPYNRNSMFRVASVTKPMTAALVLKLIDDGEFQLEDILLDHYDTPLPNAGAMRIRHVLSHTAGIYDHLNDNGFWSHPSNFPGKVWTVDELVQLAVQNGSRFQPGLSYGYSNTGFCILGDLVERKTGLSIKEAFRQMLFEPMGLERILYDDYSGPGNPIPGLAFNNRTYEYHLSAAGASGAIVASPSDVAKLGWNLYGGRYISNQLTQQMSFNYGIQVGGQNYGLGTRIWTIQGIRHYGHTGNLMNYRSILMYVPEADIAIAMSTHEPHANWFPLVDNIFLHVVNNFSETTVSRLPFWMWAGETRE